MQFELSETQLALKKSARKFFPTECQPADVRRIIEAPHAFDAALWQKIAGQGWLGMIFPEEYGGTGMGLVEMAAAYEEMGRALVPGPALSSLWAGAVILEAGSEAQKRHYLPLLASGERKATVAYLEANATWDAASLKADLSQGWLTGAKLFVTDAGVADFFVVAARSDGDLVLCIADRQQRGVSVTPLNGMDLTRPIYEVNFLSAAIPAEQVLASGTAAENAIARATGIAIVALTAEMTGGMQRVLELTVEYAKTRKQFGEPIGKFQAVQHQCADQFLLVESSRSAVLFAAWALDQNTPDAAAAVSVAKVYTSEAYREVGNRAIQIHGGMGFTWENDLHLYYRRAKLSENLFGDAIHHREQLARIVVDAAPRPAETIAHQPAIASA